MKIILIILGILLFIFCLITFLRMFYILMSINKVKIPLYINQQEIFNTNMPLIIMKNQRNKIRIALLLILIVSLFLGYSFYIIIASFITAFIISRLTFNARIWEQNFIDELKESVENNYQSKDTKSYLIKELENDYKNTDSTTTSKKLKPKTSFLVILSIIIILNVLLFSYSIFLFNSNKKLKKENKEMDINLKKKEKEDNIEFEINSNNNDKTCTYSPIDGTYYITISAESSAGVGDIFSKMDSNLEYRIHDNIYGETYISKRKYQGNPTIYECNEIWYEIYLQNGKHGFIWGGRDGMYVKEN